MMMVVVTSLQVVVWLVARLNKAACLLKNRNQAITATHLFSHLVLSEPGSVGGPVIRMSSQRNS